MSGIVSFSGDGYPNEVTGGVNNNNQCPNLYSNVSLNNKNGQFMGASSSSTPSTLSTLYSATSKSQTSSFRGKSNSNTKCPQLAGEPIMDESNGILLNAKATTTTRKPRARNNISGGGTTSSRGRPRKALVAMYHSQISGDKNAIKIRIKKSSPFSPQTQLPPNKKKTARRKRRRGTSDTDISDYEKKPKNAKYSNSRLSSANHSRLLASDKISDSLVPVQRYVEPEMQSIWGERIPENVLHNIFQIVCQQDGCLPNLVRFCRVCHLWRNVATSSLLWRKIDLNYVKEKFRSDAQLKWLIYNRLKHCQDLNLGEWKVRDVNVAIETISLNCPELQGLNLSGWKGLNADNLKSISVECKKLQRLDLSSVNVSTTAINTQPLVALGQTIASRLTHLVLAHNKMAGFTQIINSLATNCPNLQLLDISNIRTFSTNSALLHIEKLQVGCSKLKVLRITNSQIWLAPASLSEQVASPGFPHLEELSLAGLEEDQTTTSRSVGDDGIERILKNSTKLRLLDVRGCVRLTDSGLVKVPAWDLEHLFLSACCITRTQNSGLELIMQKWSHSLLEVDLAWSTATESLDAAVKALSEPQSQSRLRSLNLCGSSVSLDAVKAVLSNCHELYSLNLQSCRGLPRGIKRLYTGEAVSKLRDSLNDRLRMLDETANDGENSVKLASSPLGGATPVFS